MGENKFECQGMGWLSCGAGARLKFLGRLWCRLLGGPTLSVRQVSGMLGPRPGLASPVLAWPSSSLQRQALEDLGTFLGEKSCLERWPVFPFPFPRSHCGSCRPPPPDTLLPTRLRGLETQWLRLTEGGPPRAWELWRVWRERRVGGDLMNF